jgi:hypothetical protein
VNETANKEVFKAGYLPGLRDEEVDWKRVQLGTPNDGLTVALPELSSEQFKALASSLWRSRECDQESYSAV